MHAQSLQSCQTLCNSVNYSPSGSSALRILRQKYWSGLPCPPPENLPNLGIEAVSCTSPAFQADSLPLSHWGSPNCPQKLGKTLLLYDHCYTHLKYLPGLMLVVNEASEGVLDQVNVEKLRLKELFMSLHEGFSVGLRCWYKLWLSKGRR